MKSFIANSQLYQTFELSNNYENDAINYASKIDFDGKTFDYQCEEEGDKKTFILDVSEERILLSERVKPKQIPHFNLKNGYLDFTFKAKGICQSCKKVQVQFLFYVFSQENDSGERIIYLQKVGVQPQIRVQPNSDLTKFFDRETNIWYYKGINAISDNYGIGALAYFRRIIEKELFHIIDEIRILPDAQSMEIESLLDKHKNKPTMTTIYENIFEHLPSSLKSLGDNPIKLLYSQTSEGLHNLTDSQALEKAEIIKELLEFVIIKIKEEKSNIRDLKDKIRLLKGYD